MRNILAGPIALLLLVAACKKEPGEGGKAEIRGTVLRQDMDIGTGQPEGDPYPYHEARVYIAYGDHDYSDDDVRAGPDGTFVFPWLRKGSYRVYTFGECADCPGGSIAVQRTVEIGDKKEEVTVPTFTVENW